MARVLPFPFESLPQFTERDLTFKRRLLSVYDVVAGRKDFFDLIITPFQEILGGELHARIVAMEALSYQKLQADLQERFLIGVVRLHPQPKKALLVFDTLLAQVITAAVLSGAAVKPEAIPPLRLNPLTALQEAVVEYVIVALLEKVSAALGKKNFNLVFDDVLSDAKRLPAQFPAQEDLAVFTVRLQWLGREFFIKAALPFGVADEFGLSRYDAVLMRERCRAMAGMVAEIRLEIGQVTLEPDDLEGLSPGDIVLLDEALAFLEDKELHGQARVRVGGPDAAGGYWAQLAQTPQGVVAKIVAAL